MLRSCTALPMCYTKIVQARPSSGSSEDYTLLAIVLFNERKVTSASEDSVLRSGLSSNMERCPNT